MAKKTSVGLKFLFLLSLMAIFVWSCAFADLVQIPVEPITNLFESDTHFWDMEEESRAVKIEMNNGEGPKLYEVKTNYLYRLSTPTRDGYVFDCWIFDGKTEKTGWLKDESGRTLIVGDYLNGKEIPKTITAKWIKAGTKYTITINSQKWGTVTPSGKVQVEAGKDLKLKINSDYLTEVIYNEDLLSAEDAGTYTIRYIKSNGSVDVKYYKTDGLEEVLKLVKNYTPTSGPIVNGLIMFFVDLNPGEEPARRYVTGYYHTYEVCDQQREGYVFEGLKGDNGVLYKAGDSIDFSVGGNFPHSLVGQWKEESTIATARPISDLFEVDVADIWGADEQTKIVKVDMGDGSGTKEYEAKTNYLYRLSTPTRNGYVFDCWIFDGKTEKAGWLKDASGKTLIVGDYLNGTEMPQTITAKWIKAGTKYTITINSERWGTVTPNGKVEVEAGKDLVLDIKTDYEEEVKYNDEFLSKEDGKYIIRYVKANGSVDVKYYKTDGFEEVLKLVEDYTPKSGPVASGIVMFLVDLKPGEEPVRRYTTGYYKKYEVCNQQREGYVFEGLKGDDGVLYKAGDIIDYSVGGKFPHTLVGQWRYEYVMQPAKPITDLFEADTHLWQTEEESKIIQVDMGDGTGEKAYEAKTNYLYRLSTPTRNGYVFDCWIFDGKTEKNGWLKDASGNTLVVGDLLDGTSMPKTLTAKWIKAGTKYTITINSENWGTVTPNGKVEVEVGKDLILDVKTDYDEEVIYKDRILLKENGKYTIRYVKSNGSVDVKYYKTDGFDEVLKLVNDYTPKTGDIVNGMVMFFVDLNPGEEPVRRYTTGYYRQYEVCNQQKRGYVFEGLKGDDGILYKAGDKIDVALNNKMPHFLTGQWRRTSEVVSVTGTQHPNETNPSAIAKFKDVQETDWFYESVKDTVEKGLFKGVSETEFAPNGALTRGMLVTILYRYENASTTTKAQFEDVDPNMYYSAPIAWAADKGYVNGVGENKFAPEESITRQDLVTIFRRYALKNNIASDAGADISAFEDSDNVSEYAKDPLAWAIGNKLLNVRTATTIDPKLDATRAETAVLIHNVDALRK